MKTRIMPSMIGLVLSCTYSYPAHSFQIFPWTAGRLSDFLQELGEMGVTIPLQEPYAIDITSNNGHLVDVALESESLVVASEGVLTLDSGKSVKNMSTGVFSMEGLSHINALAGAVDAPSFDNEGVFSLAAEFTAFVSVRFVNLNGGVVHASEDSRLALSNADIRNLSSFTGPGLVEVAGRMAGDIDSAQSLAVVRQYVRRQRGADRRLAPA